MALCAKLWFMDVPGIDYRDLASPSTLLQVPRALMKRIVYEKATAGYEKERKGKGLLYENFSWIPCLVSDRPSRGE